jgi:catechol 2,3-dioxygenase-like lactoylglutathione lyase family enzyme
MIDHVSIYVTDLAKSRAFYEGALAAIGYEVIRAFPNAIGLGIKPKPDLWLITGGPRPGGQHVALRATGRKQVREFYQAAIAAGGKDNGPPGGRPQYHPHYYGAFVLDPDGNNLEACCHEPYIE